MYRSVRNHALICVEVEFEKAFDRPTLDQHSALSELASVPLFLCVPVFVCVLSCCIITVSLETGCSNGPEGL